MKKAALFAGILVPLILFLAFSLTRSPRVLPSALLGKPAPDFTLETLEGGHVALRESRGRPVVLNFWSTWCGPCLAEHETIRRAQQLFGPKGAQFYSILYEDSPENAREFLRRYGAAAPILLDPDLRTAIDYGVAGVPETFFIDTRGNIFWKETGTLKEEVLLETLPLLIASGGDDSNLEERIDRLGGQLRCPVCRGVPIAESPAALAVEMREILKQQVEAGKSDEEILDFFEERYGEWVLLEPKAEGANLAIWLLPLLFLAGGSLLIFSLVKREGKTP